MTRFRFPLVELTIVLALFAVSYALSHAAMRRQRTAGIQPSFYQGNFEPAVMMACGRGFVTAPSFPPAMVDFLRLNRNDFDCALLPRSFPTVPVTWNAPWYYLYATTAAVWRLTGISWTALDMLVSLFGAFVTAALYGLFRVVAPRSVAAAVALALTISPVNLTQLLSLRDYSKAPFVLIAVLILAVLVTRPMRIGPTLALVALYGALVGFGWGFRSDLTVMVPFGMFVVLVLLPGPLSVHVARNGLAAVILLAVFLVVAWPALRGLKMGGCQFHYALLGLTTPLTRELGMTPSLYSFGNHFLDTFIDLKVGDYAHRVLNQPISPLCSPGYDTASGQLFVQMATTFPADLVAHAYGSVLSILRVGLAIPTLTDAAPASTVGRLTAQAYRILNRFTELFAPLGPLVVLAAVIVTWAHSMRLGLALTVFVLFLTGYPAIEFEERHWFHLRFIPWWAALLVREQIFRHGMPGWTRPALVRAGAGVSVVLFTLVVGLAALRFVQTRRVGSLIARYEAAATEEMPTERHDASFLEVRWQPRDYGPPPTHRGSDLMVVTLDARNCGGTAPMVLRVEYEADAPTHDMSTEFTVARPKPGSETTRLFVPVFWTGFQDHTYLRFSGLEVVGAPPACVGRVARVTDGASLPLWVEMQLPADWSEQRLYQSIEPPAGSRHR